MNRAHSELDRVVRDLEHQVSKLTATVAVQASHLAVLLDVVQPYEIPTTTPAASADHPGDQPTPADEPGKE